MLRFTESFEMHDYDHQLEKWTGRHPDSGDFYASTGGRFGSGGWNGIQAGRYFWKTFPAGWDTWTFGGAFRWDSGPGSNFMLVQFYVAGVGEQISMRVNSAGNRLVISRNGTTLGTGTIPIGAVGTWYYIEFQAFIHDSTGYAEIRVDGVTDVAVSGVDTKAQSSSTADTLYMLETSGFGGSISLDDIYLLDGVDSGVSGAPNDDFLGDIRVQALFPNGNGNSSQLDGSDGNTTDNYLLVDETNPNGDTDYVESLDVGDKDTYAFTNLSATSGIVYGLVTYPFAKKTDAGLREICGVTRSAGVEEDGPDLTLTASYQYYIDPRDGDPSGNQWTISSINAMEVGVKVTT